MEYTIDKLAKMAGVSARTLRYYDQIGLLKPKRTPSGYRVYGKAEVDRLQQILLYREMGIPLEEIKKIIASPDFDRVNALRTHLEGLLSRREQLDLLIENVQKSIVEAKGEIKMNDSEKFKGFIDKMVEDNERKYGAEVREKYGDEAADLSNAKLMGLSKEQYEELKEIEKQFTEALKAAYEQGDPESELAQKACELHRKWLGFFWNFYNKEAHLGLAQMYVDDPRFGEYFDNIAKGSAAFLKKALEIYCK